MHQSNPYLVESALRNIEGHSDTTAVMSCRPGSQLPRFGYPSEYQFSGEYTCGARPKAPWAIAKTQQTSTTRDNIDHRELRASPVSDPRHHNLLTSQATNRQGFRLRRAVVHASPGAQWHVPHSTALQYRVEFTACILVFYRVMTATARHA